MDEKYCGWSKELGISLLDKLKADLKSAMLKKDDLVRNTVRQIMSEYPKLTVPLTLESGKKSFRLKKGEEITDDYQRGFFKRIADEDKKHYFLLTNIIDFVSRPESWLENAEFCFGFIVQLEGDGRF